MDYISNHLMAMAFTSYFSGGPTPKFSMYHIWKAFQVIDKQGPIGRKALADALQIGEGSIRTILEKMAREGSIENTRMGTVITKKGRRKFENSGIEVAQVDLQDLTLGKHNCAVLIKAMGFKVKMGCEQRDEAVRAGAVGATTLIVKSDRMVFPGDEDFPDQAQVAPLRTVFKIEDNDVIIVGSAFSYDAAEKGAVTAALALGTASRRCWTEGTTLITQDTEADDLKCLCLAIHELLNRSPVTMRSRNHNGVRCEDGEVVDTNYTGPMLEEALRKGQTIRRTASTGPFRGLPVVVVPILRKKEAVAAIGAIDISKAPMYEMLSKGKKDKG
jgi:predicted transcriptional regulator